MILSIETATSNCSVALHQMDGTMLALHERDEQNIHASQLFLFIKEVLADRPMHELKAIAVSKGPGSYTGLRIGVSAAKGLCYSLGVPLIAVNTLLGMASTVAPTMENKDAVLAPLLDARRMEVYNAAFSMKLETREATRATVVDEHFFEAFAKQPCYFFGNGMPKCRPVLSAKPNHYFLEDIAASASAIGALAVEKYKGSEFEDVAYFEPYYLKEFVTQSAFHKK
jgi:tRNA threonylcarbamoyladenosine biosynthesis protein TsaB